MKRFIFMVFILSGVLFAGALKLDEKNSKVYYEASKDQFFMTFEVIGINTDLKGDIEKDGDTYKGMLYIDSSKFDSDNSIRDSHVREDYLKSEEFSFIRFDYEIKDNMAKGILLVHGVPKQIEFPIKLSEDENSLNIQGSIKIKYSDFAIPTPSTLIVTAYDELTIGANLNFIK